MYPDMKQDMYSYSEDKSVYQIHPCRQCRATGLHGLVSEVTRLTPFSIPKPYSDEHQIPSLSQLTISL